MRRFRSPTAFLLIVLGFFFPVSLWADNVENRPAVIKLLLVGFTAGFVAWLLAVLVHRLASVPLTQAASLIGVAFGFFALWAYLVGLVDSLVENVATSTALVALCGVGAMLFVIRFGRSRRFFTFLTFFASGLLVASLIQVTIRTARLSPPELGGLPAVVTPGNGASLPDIYVVILDGYARDDVMDDLFGFDNSPFIGSLDTAGFTTFHSAVANYSMT